MKFEELIRVCHTSDTNIKTIFIEAETKEAKKLISDSSLILSGIGIPLQQACENEDYNDMEVLGIKIKNDSTLTIVV